MRIVHVVGSLQSSHGGPSRSVPRLAKALAEIGIDSTIVHAPFSEAVPPEVDEARAAGVRVLAVDGADARNRAIGDADVVHLHGIWSPLLHWSQREAMRRLAPVVVSLRGMLTPWAWNHHRWRKNLAWALYQRRDLDRASLIHATSSEEAENVRSLGLRPRVTVIPNGIDIPSDAAAFTGPRRIVFLARLHVVKGLSLLIGAVELLANELRQAGWRVVIAGPGEPDERRRLQDELKSRRIEDLVDVRGELDADAKWDLIRSAHLFILPSYSENFGLVVAEALAAGVPVITTTATPWKTVNEVGCGWCVAPTHDGVREALRLAVGRSTADLTQMGILGRKWVAADYSWTGVASRFRAEYETVSAGGPR